MPMYYIRVLFFIFLVSPVALYAGTQSADSLGEKKMQVFNTVEQMPEFPKGNDRIGKYLGAHLHYPRDARERNVQGRVLVKFIVNEDGSLSDITLLEGIGGGCDEEVVRVISGMPRWKPGKQNGKNVKTFYTLPVTFQIAR